MSDNTDFDRFAWTGDEVTALQQRIAELEKVVIGNAELWRGDCLEVMKTLEANSIDAVCTDPPYGLSFMCKDWDHGVPGVLFWTEALRVLKPGGYLLAFGGTRTFHWLAVAIEDAGFEIRDTLMWVYGSGFPKSHNVSKAIDKAVPATKAAKQWDGWGTALKPAWEPIIMARKPLEGTVAANVLKHGTGGINVNATRTPHLPEADRASATPQGRATSKNSHSIGATPDAGRGESRVEFDRSDTSKGRWPANLIHDGSDEVLAGFPETKSGKQAAGGHTRNSDKTRNAYGKFEGQRCEGDVLYGDSGSAARFFYCAKASKAERNAGLPAGQTSTHPTVKPVALMRWLVRMVTPPNGIVLDPFMGSGTTGVAAAQEGVHFIGIELSDDYVAIAERRIASAQAQGTLLLP